MAHEQCMKQAAGLARERLRSFRHLAGERFITNQVDTLMPEMVFNLRGHEYLVIADAGRPGGGDGSGFRRVFGGVIEMT